MRDEPVRKLGSEAEHAVWRAVPIDCDPVPGIQVCELMPRSAKIMQHLCVVRGMCTSGQFALAGVPRIQRGDPKNEGVNVPVLWLSGREAGRLAGDRVAGVCVDQPGVVGSFIRTPGLGPQFGAVAFATAASGKFPSLPDPSAMPMTIAAVAAKKTDERYRLRRRRDQRKRPGTLLIRLAN